jgi:N-dimethylarginine dimethylaminohydrolase
VHATAAGPELRELLRDRDVDLVEFEPGPELDRARAMNLVTLAPRRVLMPSGASRIRRRLERAGVTVEEIQVSEYVKAAGGLGCLTGVIHRDP